MLLGRKWPWIFVPLVEPMLGEKAAHGQPTVQFGTVKNSLGLLDQTENGPCELYAKYCLNWMA